jgi:hypothetical protein
MSGARRAARSFGGFARVLHRLLPLTVPLFATFACARPEPLVLRSHDAGPGGVARLNQPIVLAFNTPLDPGSVRPETVRVVRLRDGAAVAGRLAVAAASVTFAPKIACRPDLADGALEPGERYRVEVPGLPQLACVRSLDGFVLDAGVSFEFTTVAAARDAAARELFVDASPGVRPHFGASAQIVDGVVRLRFSKPLDPRTIPNTKFWFNGPWHLESKPWTDPLFKACLVENDPEAVIELSSDVPPPFPLDPSEKHYAVEIELSKLRDFSDVALTPDKGAKSISLTFVPKEKKDNP